MLGTLEVEQGLTEFGAKETSITFDPVNETRDLVFVYRNEAEDGLVCIGLYLEFKRDLAS